MIFQGSGGRSWHHFLIFLECLFQDRFLIVLGSVLGSILEPFGLPNGVYVEGFGGLFWDCFCYGFLSCWLAGEGGKEILRPLLVEGNALVQGPY